MAEVSTKKNKILGIIFSLILIGLGVVCFVLPTIFADAITNVLGVAFISLGIMFMLFAFTTITGAIINLVSSSLVLGGVVSVVLGILLFTNPDGIIKLIGIIFAVLSIVSGIFKLCYVPAFKVTTQRFWISELVLAILYIVLGIVICCNLNNLKIALIYLLGIYLIIFGSSKLIDNCMKVTPKYEFKISKNKDKNKIKEDDEVIDANFTEKE